MGEITVVVGLSGVGKGTVLDQAMNLADRDYLRVNYGDRMLREARDRDLVDSRDEMKDLDPETSREIQRIAAESIVKDAETEDVILETHAAIQTPHGYLPGLPERTVKSLDPDMIVIVDADSGEILERSREDNSRDREHSSEEQVQRYREIAREMASANAVMAGAYLAIVENRPGGAEEAAEELLRLLKS